MTEAIPIPRIAGAKSQHPTGPFRENCPRAVSMMSNGMPHKTQIST